MPSPVLASSSQSGAPNRRPTHNPKSNLAGITFETSHGRFVCLFWQSTTGDIWQSRFLVARSCKWELWSTVLVAGGAKQETPLAAVTWANGLKQSVFFLDDSNIIHERLSTDSGQTWEDGSLNNMTIGVGSKSKLAAAADSPLQDNITLKVALYYQDRWGEIRQLRYLHDPLCMVTGAENFRDRWTPGSRCPASPIKGSSITAGLDYKAHKSSWIYYVLPSGAVEQANWPTGMAACDSYFSGAGTGPWIR
ncbi:hypothetical protein BDZ91DRAFT_730210 [Kalaharituber pfeilii]|nr:hypothetical protein BDZ91DRAFT_730210 [Kalaharituber pfeilii]